MGVAKYVKNEKDAIEEVIYQSGIRVKPVYTPQDLDDVGFDYEKDLGDPGQYPFTRSLHPQGYRSRAWTTRQYTGFGTPEETNKRFQMMISHGQTGLNVAFDLPTQMGYDSDDPRVVGEVGRVGMAVDSLRDFETAFAGIPLDRIGSGPGSTRLKMPCVWWATASNTPSKSCRAAIRSAFAGTTSGNPVRPRPRKSPVPLKLPGPIWTM